MIIEKSPTWTINNKLLNNPWDKEVPREILKYTELNENENKHINICGTLLKQY